MAKRLNKENIVTLLRLIRSWINRKADKDALITGGVTKLGTSTVGSASKPIYWSNGEPKATSGTLGVSITGNAASATEASKAINADNATTAATAEKLGTVDVGSEKQPIYIKAGKATIGTALSDLAFSGWEDFVEPRLQKDSSHRLFITTTQGYFKIATFDLSEPYKGGDMIINYHVVGFHENAAELGFKHSYNATGDLFDFFVVENYNLSSNVQFFLYETSTNMFELYGNLNAYSVITKVKCSHSCYVYDVQKVDALPTEYIRVISPTLKYINTVDKNAKYSFVNSMGIYNALTNGTVTKVGTSDVGSPTLPIYLNKGVPTVGRGNVLGVTGGTKNGTISVTVGTGGTPGTTASDVAITGLKSLAYLDTVPIASAAAIGGVKLCSAGDARLTLTTNTTSKRYLQVETSDDSKGLAYIEYPAWDGNTIKVSNNKLYVDTKSVVSLGTALSWSGNKINPTIGTMAIGTGITALSTGTYKNITKVTNGLVDEQTVAAIADRLFELEKKVVAYLGTA